MGWLTPLIPHVSGGRRGRRWRIPPPPTVHGEAMSFEVGDKAATQMEREWFHPEQALDTVFCYREWAKLSRLAREEAAEIKASQTWRKVVRDPEVEVYWVATKMGRCRHATTSPMYRNSQYRHTACGGGWTVHACSVSELQRLPVCPACSDALDLEAQEDFLMKEAGR